MADGRRVLVTGVSRFWGAELARRLEADPGVEQMLLVQDALSRWEKPALVAFSDGDPVFPFPRSGEVFTKLIPGAGEQVRIEGAAHFLQEDRGPQIVETMLSAFGRPVARA